MRIDTSASTTSTPSSESSASQRSSSAREQGAAARQSLNNATRSFRSWLEGMFPGHVNAALFAILGFVVAIILFTMGFWPTILLILLVGGGYAFGQQLDGDPKIIRTIRSWFNANRRR